MQIVLSLFPGIGMLDMAFEEAGFCVVRGPDLLWGGDVRNFHPPAGRFDGVIGGPPCQAFSTLAHFNAAQGKTPKHGNLIPEFERVVSEAQPQWFVMENVTGAPEPEVSPYRVHSVTIRDHWCGGETVRERRFSFGSEAGRRLPIQTLALHPDTAARAVTGDARMASVGERLRNKASAAKLPWDEVLRLQGLPSDFLASAPFTDSARRQMVGNGVPLAMGRAVAAAVIKALEASPGHVIGICPMTGDDLFERVA